MNINTVIPTRDAITGATTSTTGTSGLGQQAFLQLLSTQLANQDPTAPQDQSQMLAQLAQFSTLEGINNLGSTANQTEASNMLGKTVQATITVNNQPQSLSGKVTAVKWDTSGVSLTLDDAAQSSVTLAQITQVSN